MMSAAAHPRLLRLAAHAGFRSIEGLSIIHTSFGAHDALQHPGAPAGGT
jgi:hypothetical protein